jgi:hypothetical protein
MALGGINTRFGEKTKILFREDNIVRVGAGCQGRNRLDLVHSNGGIVNPITWVVTFRFEIEGMDQEEI